MELALFGPRIGPRSAVVHGRLDRWPLRGMRAIIRWRGLLIARRKFRKVVINEQRHTTEYDCLTAEVAAACDLRSLRPRCLARTGAVLLAL
jgi:hypothetical protein